MPMAKARRIGSVMHFRRVAAAPKIDAGLLAQLTIQSSGRDGEIRKTASQLVATARAPRLVELAELELRSAGRTSHGSIGVHGARHGKVLRALGASYVNGGHRGIHGEAGFRQREQGLASEGRAA